MLAALLPVAGTLGVLGAMRVAAARGELRALAAIGVEPQRAAAGAVAGGAALGMIGPVVAALGIGDLAALFPRPVAVRTWVVDGDGLRELALGVRVGAGGVLSLEAPAHDAESALPHAAMSFAVAALAVAAVVCPVWVATAEGGSPWRRAAVGAGAILTAVAAFQAVGAGRLPAVGLLAAPLVLLIDAATARYRARAR
jgi:hypothetical protein